MKTEKETNKKVRKASKDIPISNMLVEVGKLRVSHRKLLENQLGREPTEAEVDERVCGVVTELLSTLDTKEKK